MESTAYHTLNSIVQGDHTAFLHLLNNRFIITEDILDNEIEFLLTACAVRRILSAWQEGDITPEQIQSWASFVRRGYIANANGQPEAFSRPVRPVNIVYDPNAEDEIVNIIGRLDEIGDLVDGIISPDELSEMIEQMTRLLEG